MIYAIQCGESGPIKIGRARNVRKRLTGLQISHFEKLHVRATLETLDDVGKELELHKRYAADRIRGEWFKPSPDVLAMVEQLKNTKPDTLQDYAMRIVEDYRAHMAKYNLLRLFAYFKRRSNAQPVHQG